MIPVTSLAAYDYCPRKLFLEHVLKFASSDRAAMVRGSLHHKCLEQFTASEEALIRRVDQSMSYQDVVTSFVTHASEIGRNQLDVWGQQLSSVGLDVEALRADIGLLMHSEARRRARDVFSVVETDSVFGDGLWELLVPKRRGEKRLKLDDVGVRGIIDCILEFRDGVMVPVEYKTGKAPSDGVWPGHRIQVTAYVMMVEAVFGASVPFGIVRYLDINEDRKVFVNPMMRDEFITLAGEVSALLSADTLPAHVSNERKCEKCYLKQHCYDASFMENRLKSVVNSRLSGAKVENFVI